MILNVVEYSMKKGWEVFELEGKQNWYLVDGYRPSLKPDPTQIYEGHESVMVLNPNPQDANVTISIYFEDREPYENIPLLVPAKRIRAFRTDDVEVLAGCRLGVGEQYSMVLRSDVGVIVQYGRLDVQQPNMAYMALMGHSE